MVLSELTAVPSGSMPVSELSEHLHLGTGFADDGSQDSVLESYLRAALAAIEARTGKAIIQRRFSWIVNHWIAPDQQGLPVSPVQSIEEVRVATISGAETVIPSGSYGLRKDMHRPALISAGGHLPGIPNGGQAEVIFEAGFGPTWNDVPADLRQAVLALAAHYFEDRQGVQGTGNDFPAHVLVLIEPHRSLRLSGRAA